MLVQKFEIIERRSVTVIVQTDDPHVAYQAIERWADGMPESVDDVCATGDWQPYQGGDVLILDVNGKVITEQPTTSSASDAPAAATPCIPSIEVDG